MFGAYRYILALLAIFSHFHPIYFGRLNWVGMYALFGFYVLSGYLMTRVLHETYGFSGRGIRCFLWNRALRIYPAYWVAAIVSLLVAIAIPETVALYTRMMGAPTTAGDMARNVFIFGLDAWHAPRLVTPAWSLHVELAFYVLMAIGLARSPRVVACWIAVSIAYTAYLVHANVDFAFRYSTIPAASLPFSVGAGTYFLTRRARASATGLFTYAPRALAVAAVAAFLAADFGAAWLVPNVMLQGFYLGLALNAAVVFCLAQVRLRAATPRLARLDRLLGDLTYPMFLLHFPIEYALTACLSPGAKAPETALFLLALPAVNVAALLVVMLVDRQIEPSRVGVRAAAVATDAVRGAATAT